MTVEANPESVTTRQIVPITWDKEVVTGELVQLLCVNPENGDSSQSGITKNTGSGKVSYPQGYSGTTEITVVDNDGNADFGVVTVGEGGAVEPPVEPPTEPTEPVDPGWGIDIDTGYLRPTHPIVLPPDVEPPVEPPIIDWEDPGYNPPPGANHVTPA